MRTVKTFSLGRAYGGTQELVVVAKDNKFSHAHYFVRYPDGDHIDLYPDCYQSPEAVAEEVRQLSGRPQWADSDLEEVGCNVRAATERD